MDFMRAVISFILMAVVCGTGAGASPTAIPPADHESILYALRYAGLTSSAAALDAAISNGGFLVPPSATILVPTNAAMETVADTDTDNLVGVFAYHVMADNFPVDVLTSLPVGMQIPTLLPDNTLLVTDNHPRSFRINARELMAVDVCAIHTVACYAVDVVFDSKMWGHADLSAVLQAPALPPSGLPLPPVGAPVLPPVGAPIVPPVGSPLTPPAFPPRGSPGGAPLPGTPGGAPLPGTPGGTPGPSPPGAPSAAVMASTPCHAVVVAALMVVILFM